MGTTSFVSCSDCRLSAFTTNKQAKQKLIKGDDYSINKVLLDNHQQEYPLECAAFDLDEEQSAMQIYRLCPADYHRFHSPAKCKIIHINKCDFDPDAPPSITVKTLAIKDKKWNPYTRNTRINLWLQMSDQADHYFVLSIVGATAVDKIKLDPVVEVGNTLQKGQEIGWFEYGASTLLAYFGKKMSQDISMAKDLLDNTTNGFETYVKVRSDLI
jgi:phosphatidylserine decarboxylase